MAPCYFGNVADDGRLELEEHMASCPECLQSYFALKRSVEMIDRCSCANVNLPRLPNIEQEVQNVVRDSCSVARPMTVVVASKMAIDDLRKDRSVPGAPMGSPERYEPTS